jgi:putative nucleotidyltransferase with HDIG domain
MGSPKQLMDLGGKKVLARVIRAHQEAGAGHLTVVTGHLHDEISDLAESLGAHPVQNPYCKEGMFSSVQAGIAALPDEADAFLVHPVDIPLVRPWTLKLLAKEFSSSRPQVLHPVFEGKRGHPPLLDAGLISHLAAWNGSEGLKGALAAAGGETLELEVPDQAILWDMDTPGDHARLDALAPRRGIPSPAECLVMMQTTFGLEPSLVDHCRAVAHLAELMASALNEAGQNMNLSLVRAGGLLHDLAKGHNDHAAAGSDLLKRAGFPQVARIAREHVDLPPRGRAPVDESELVYLADKLVEGDLLVGIGQRFAGKQERHGKKPGVGERIQARLALARESQARVEALAGRPLRDIVA